MDDVLAKKIEEMAQTYSMKYKCSNCGNVYQKKVLRGHHANGRGGDCPYCGCSDDLWRPFRYVLPGKQFV